MFRLSKDRVIQVRRASDRGRLNACEVADKIGYSWQYVAWVAASAGIKLAPLPRDAMLRRNPCADGYLARSSAAL